MQQCKNSALKYWLIICIAILIAFISSKAKADEEYGEYNGLNYTIIDDGNVGTLSAFLFEKIIVENTKILMYNTRIDRKLINIYIPSKC
jgi:hypothetical protein